MRMKIELMKHNLRIALAFAMCLVALTVIAMSAGENDTYGQWLPGRKTAAVDSAVAAAADRPSAPPAMKRETKSFAEMRGDLYRQFQSGQRSSAEIQNEIAQMVGDHEGIEFNRKNINRAYKLSIVLSHYKNMLSDPYEVLFLHTFSGYDQPEDTLTFFTRKLDGAEERNTRGQIVFSRLIEISDKGEPQFALSSRMDYKFGLEDHPIKRTFDLREPVGTYQISEAPVATFDPLALLTNHDRPFDYGLYHNLMSWNGKQYDVQITVRPTEIETLTIEVRLQETKSLVTQSFVLVYEEL